jgi:hypothetical protein
MNREGVPTISASELGQYAFCARGWWLGRTKGYASLHTQEMASGSAAHLAHGRSVMRYLGGQRLAWVLWLLATLAGLVGLYWGLQGR